MKRMVFSLLAASLLTLCPWGLAARGDKEAGKNGEITVESGVKRGGIVNVTSSKQGVLIKNFNPFSPNALRPTFGCFYEPLVFANAYSGDILPWLAESFSWSEDLKTLNFNLRKDVQWNDGNGFDADDVIFTVELGKDNKVLDKIGIWKQGLVSIEKIDQYSVAFHFDEVNTTILPGLGSLYIIPEHIWAAIDNPSEWTGNENPVGTGPFLFEDNSFSEQSYRLKKNPSYWQMGMDGKPLPYINGIQYIGATGNAQAQMKIISGEIDWGMYFIANIEETYAKRDKLHNHYWIPEGNLVYLNLNNGTEPFNSRNMRRALAMAIDQEEITTIMNSGAVPADQGGVKTGYLSWIPQSASKYKLSFDPPGAVKIMEGEGYTKNDKGIMEKNGKELSFALYVPTGWTDWITAVETISNQLKAVGIEARVTQVAWPSPFLDNITTGEYYISIDFVNSGFSPYYQYNSILPSRHWAEVGEEATGHSQVRFKDPAIDRAFDDYRKTDDPDKQLESIGYILETVMKETPLIPLFFNPTWFEYSTRNFTGWPNADDPYTMPMVANMDKMPIFLRIQPRK